MPNAAASRPAAAKTSSAEGLLPGGMSQARRLPVLPATSTMIRAGQLHLAGSITPSASATAMQGPRHPPQSCQARIAKDPPADAEAYTRTRRCAPRGSRGRQKARKPTSISSASGNPRSSGAELLDGVQLAHPSTAADPRAISFGTRISEAGQVSDHRDLHPRESSRG